MINDEQRRYPVGRLKTIAADDYSQVKANIAEIAAFPKTLKDLLSECPSSAYVDTYRPDGWTLYQVVHHAADSHMVAYQRMKRAVTDPGAKVYGYYEERWADLSDVTIEIKDSLLILEGLHNRWTRWLSSLTTDELTRQYYHLSDEQAVTVSQAINTYAWHSKHHLGHIRIIVDNATL